MGPNWVKPCETVKTKIQNFLHKYISSNPQQCARQWVLSSSADFSDSFLCVMNCFMGPNGVKPCYASPSLDNQYGHVRTCSKLKELGFEV